MHAIYGHFSLRGSMLRGSIVASSYNRVRVVTVNQVVGRYNLLQVQRCDQH